MKITFKNFGGFRAATLSIRSHTQPNSWGKTTLLNGFVWVLTGKTLGGFDPRRKGTPDDEPTEAILEGFCGLSSIRRTTSRKGGTVLYIGPDVATQTDFADVLQRQFGVDIDFVVTCTDANVLTSDTLTSEELRKLLTRADVMDNGEAANLRKEAEKLRKDRKTAEQYALSNVVVPTRTCAKPTESDDRYLDEFNRAKKVLDAGLLPHCRTCGQLLDKDTLDRMRYDYNCARVIVEQGEEEYKRICDVYEKYDHESDLIRIAEAQIAAAQKARNDVQTYTQRLKEIDEKLRELDATAVRAELPDGVTLITEQTSSTGRTTSVCTLEYNGVPLKSVNRAMRIEICVRILDRAREAKGMQDIPIWIDNAEAVQGLQDVPNVIRLTVG